MFMSLGGMLNPVTEYFNKIHRIVFRIQGPIWDTEILDFQSILKWVLVFIFYFSPDPNFFVLWAEFGPKP